MTVGNVSAKRSTTDFVGSDLHFCRAGIRASSRHTWLHRSTAAWVWTRSCRLIPYRRRLPNFKGPAAHGGAGDIGNADALTESRGGAAKGGCGPFCSFSPAQAAPAYSGMRDPQFSH